MQLKNAAAACQFKNKCQLLRSRKLPPDYLILFFVRTAGQLQRMRQVTTSQTVRGARNRSISSDYPVPAFPGNRESMMFSLISYGRFEDGDAHAMFSRTGGRKIWVEPVMQTLRGVNGNEPEEKWRVTAVASTHAAMPQACRADLSRPSSLAP